MEASSSIFSPESWTLLPRREWLQDAALKHQDFQESESISSVACPAQRDGCIGNSFCGSFPGQATAQMLSTLSQLPACDADSRIKPQNPPSSTLGWDLSPDTFSPARFFAFLKQCGWTMEHPVRWTGSQKENVGPAARGAVVVNAAIPLQRSNHTRAKEQEPGVTAQNWNITRMNISQWQTHYFLSPKKPPNH